MLWREYEIKNNRIDYFGLLSCFFLMFKEKYIFTLNHDLLLEDLLHYYNKEYSDGFTANHSPLRGDDNENIEIFNNNYDKEIKVFKLHGSIDYYKYDYFIKEGLYFNPTGEYVFFKPKTYHNKHVAKRIDLESGSVLQSLTVNITPQFLTGKNKPDIIKKLTFYESLFKNFNEVLKTTTDLMIIGYSFKDNHINDMLGQAAQNGTIKNIYNINISNTNFFEKCGFAKNYFYYDNISSF
jgi:SIR2-like domain